MPEDFVPYWDMKAPGVDGLQSHVAVDSVPRDASAAALIASGLYELCTYITPEKGKRYKSIADKIVGNLGRHYTTVSCCCTPPGIIPEGAKSTCR